MEHVAKLSVYIAFSIAGSNCFISASKSIEHPPVRVGDSLNIDGWNFTVGQSRTGSIGGATKLLSSELNHGGRPLKNAQKIYDFFTDLESEGWNLKDADFVRRHGVTKKQYVSDSLKSLHSAVEGLASVGAISEEKTKFDEACIVQPHPVPEPKEPEAKVSSGNVFKDIGVDNPDDALKMADIIIQMKNRVRELEITKAIAAERIGIDPKKLDGIFRGRTSAYNSETLQSYLSAIG